MKKLGPEMTILIQKLNFFWDKISKKAERNFLDPNVS